MNAYMMELQIAASPVRDAIPKDKPLTERIAFACRYVRKNERDLFWMSPRVTDDLMFRTALAGVMMAGDDSDRDIIKRSRLRSWQHEWRTNRCGYASLALLNIEAIAKMIRDA